MHSIREILGFALTAVFLVAVFREQRLAVFFLALIGLGTALTGFFPTYIGIAITMSIMSVGFHYYETYAQSLQLQWFPKDRAPVLLGWVVTVYSLATIVAIGGSWLLFQFFSFDYWLVFLVGGGVCVAAALVGGSATIRHRREATHRPRCAGATGLIALTFFAGARRQIFGKSRPAGRPFVRTSGAAAADPAQRGQQRRCWSRLHRAWRGRTPIIEYIGLVPIFIFYGIVTPWVALLLFISTTCSSSWPSR